jgi:hypothetical protein
MAARMNVLMFSSTASPAQHEDRCRAIGVLVGLAGVN